MVSGKYSALAGAISREQNIANISNNLANISTSGYKKSQVSFESILRGEKQSTKANGINYNRIRHNFTDFSQGVIKQTEDPHNLAIKGTGFFKVQGPNGALYTKRGDFAINEEGLLITANGLPVLDEGNSPIIIPDTDTNKVAVNEEGIVFVIDLQGDSRSEVARLAIVDIADELQLKREQDTTYSLENAGLESPSANSRILQGSLELSNVNMSAEMAKMIYSNRIFETYHKVLKSYSTISEQQQELGTLG